MVKEIRFYFEGDSALKPGFRGFLREIVDVARSQKIRCEFVATDATPAEDYKIALNTHRDAFNVLILDSEGPFHARLLQQKGLPAATEQSVFWMVQAMESWFLGDIEALKAYYKDGFRDGACRLNPKIEEIPKQDVFEALKAATKDTKKGSYHKTGHAPGILARLDAQKVRRASTQCSRLFETVLRELSVPRN
jgi:hypothetical protein